MDNEATVDAVMPEGKWKFDTEVADAFDDMLRRSIPQYEVMRQSCFEIGKVFVQRSTDIVDLGCSRGEALAPYVDKFGVNNRYIGLEVAEPMLEAARKRFEGYIKTGYVDIRKNDLRIDYPRVKASLTQAILTLQFTPIEYRQKILNAIFATTVPGGAFILVEKVLGSGYEIDSLLVEQYLTLKAEHGYSQEQIERKRLSLEGVLVPVTAAWNEGLLKGAGFSQVDCFWRYLNFAGWVAIKQ